MNDKLIQYGHYYDKLYESMEEEIELVQFQHVMLEVAKNMYKDGQRDEEFIDKTIEVLKDFIKVGKEVAIKFNTLIMINDKIMSVAKRLGTFETINEHLGIEQRNEEFRMNVEILTDKEHEEFLNELLQLKM